MIFRLTGVLPASVESLITLLNANQSDRKGQVVYWGLLRKYPPSFHYWPRPEGLVGYKGNDSESVLFRHQAGQQHNM